MVEVACLSHPVVGFIDGVGKVYEDDSDVYPASVLNVEGCPWLGLRVASTNDDAVVDCLNPSCHKLGDISAFAYVLIGGANGYMREGAILGSHIWKKGPANVGKEVVDGDAGGGSHVWKNC